MSELVRGDGTHRSTVVVSRGDRAWSRSDGAWSRSDGLAFRFGTATTDGGDPRYPLPVEWEAGSGTLAARVAVAREIVRMHPLDILPQPFRMLIALGGRPELAWAEATADVRIADPAESAVRAHGSGIVLAAFARANAIE